MVVMVVVVVVGSGTTDHTEAADWRENQVHSVSGMGVASV